MAVRAVARGVGLSAKRLRPVVDAVRGKGVEDSLNRLRFLPGPAAARVAKVLQSAAANAQNNLGLNPNRLKVVQAYVDGGAMIERVRAKARGRAGQVLRHSSHITIEVDEG